MLLEYYIYKVNISLDNPINTEVIRIIIIIFFLLFFVDPIIFLDIIIKLVKSNIAIINSPTNPTFKLPLMEIPILSANGNGNSAPFHIKYHLLALSTFSI